MPTLKIDGQEVTVPEGTSVIEAAFKAGVTVPHYCYHPKLSVAGNCRMCLVEVEGLRKPEISCNLAAREGMVVHTQSEKVKKLRQGVLEFLFLNHPIDCPICDKAGECKLQDYYLDHGKYESRLEEGKIRKPKRLDIGEHIILDAERCVLCSRCIRFCDEVTGTGELRFSERGAHMQIGIHPDKRLDNRYSMCTTDVCPVGALTAKPFRFQARVWFLERTPSVCTGCSQGCNIEVHQYRGEVKRYMPRRNDFVNDTWMCDEGRLTYQNLQGEGRLWKARVGAGETQKDISLEEGLRAAASAVGRLNASNGAASVGFVLSPGASNEDNFLLTQLRDAIAPGAPLYMVAGNPPGSKENDDDGLLIRADKNPNTNGAKLVATLTRAQGPGALKADIEAGKVRGLVVLSNDVLGKVADAPDIAKVFTKLDTLITLATHSNTTTQAAQIVLPLATHVETDGTFVNHHLRLQRFLRAVDSRGDAKAGWELIPALAAACGASLEKTTAAQVFNALCQAHPHLEGITFEAVGEAGLSLKPADASAA